MGSSSPRTSTYVFLHPENTIRRCMLVKQPDKLLTIVDHHRHLSDQVLYREPWVEDVPPFLPKWSTSCQHVNLAGKWLQSLHSKWMLKQICFNDLTGGITVMSQLLSMQGCGIRTDLLLPETRSTPGVCPCRKPKVGHIHA